MALDINSLLTIGITLVVAGVALAIGVQVIADTGDSIAEDNCADRSDGFTSYNATAEQCYNSTGSHVAVGTYEYNATSDSLTSVTNITSKLPTVGLVVAAVVIIGLLIGAFAMRR